MGVPVNLSLKISDLPFAPSSLLLKLLEAVLLPLRLCQGLLKAFYPGRESRLLRLSVWGSDAVCIVMAMRPMSKRVEPAFAAASRAFFPHEWKETCAINNRQHLISSGLDSPRHPPQIEQYLYHKIPVKSHLIWYSFSTRFTSASSSFFTFWMAFEAASFSFWAFLTCERVHAWLSDEDV